MALQKKRGLWDEEDEILEHAHDMGLPTGPLLKVFACLPALSIFHLRLVCKAWNSLLRSPLLLTSWHPSSPIQEAWLVMGKIGFSPSPLLAFQFLAYCPSTQTWLRLPVDSASNPHISAFLRTSSCFHSLKTDSCKRRFCTYDTIVADSDGGLICCVIEDCLLANSNHVGRVSIVVFNPLSGAVRELPPPPDLDVAFGNRQKFSISICAKGGAHPDYHVILSELGKNFINKFYVYSSVTDVWKMANGESSYKELCGSVNDVLNSDFFRTMSSLALKGYNIKQDRWSVIEATSPELRRCDICGFKWNGNLYAARKWRECPKSVWNKPEESLGLTFREKSTFSANYGFSVFKFEGVSDTVGQWVEISRTPPHCVLSTNTIVWGITMMANENLVCLKLMHTSRQAPLVYNLCTDTWFQVPPYKGSYSFENLFVFTPRLDAAV